MNHNISRDATKNRVLVSKNNNGKLKIPEEILSELDIKDGDSILFVKKDSSWIITTRDQKLEEAQAYLKSLNPDNESLVDELIAERRAEALREGE